MITDTSYDSGSPGKLMSYMSRDEGRDRELRDHRGQELGAEDRKQFRENAVENGMYRHYSMNPDPGLDWSEDDLDRGVRATMAEFRTDRQSVEYCYAVHEGEDRPHAHVVMTGDTSDIYMDTQDIETFENTAERKMDEPLKRDAADRTREAAQVLDASFDRSRGRSR
jgi:hypothetical protein